MLEKLRKCLAVAPFGNVIQKLSKQLSLGVFAGFPADYIYHSGGNHNKVSLRLGCGYLNYAEYAVADQPSRPVSSGTDSYG
ncbi:MAG: hypothetical protein WBN88_10235 [Anderseniella sp.]